MRDSVVVNNIAHSAYARDKARCTHARHVYDACVCRTHVRDFKNGFKWAMSGFRGTSTII